MQPQSHQTRAYQLAVAFSILFALVGFSYNVWRMEASEENSNVRTACFELLLELSELEQLIYSAHFDGDTREGSPRKGWVKVGLIVDLSVLTSPAVEDSAQQLRQIWASHWEQMPSDRAAVDSLVGAIDTVRGNIKTVLRALE